MDRVLLPRKKVGYFRYEFESLYPNQLSGYVTKLEFTDAIERINLAIAENTTTTALTILTLVFVFIFGLLALAVYGFFLNNMSRYFSIVDIMAAWYIYIITVRFYQQRIQAAVVVTVDSLHFRFGRNAPPTAWTLKESDDEDILCIDCMVWPPNVRTAATQTLNQSLLDHNQNAVSGFLTYRTFNSKRVLIMFVLIELGGN